MAADYIAVDRSKQLGNKLVRAASLQRELRELIEELNDVGQHSFDGSDYAVMEDNFGLGAGTGANTLTLIGLVHTIYNSSATVAGTDRLSQLNEFEDRLSGQ